MVKITLTPPFGGAIIHFYLKLNSHRTSKTICRAWNIFFTIFFVFIEFRITHLVRFGGQNTYLLYIWYCIDRLYNFVKQILDHKTLKTVISAKKFEFSKNCFFIEFIMKNESE